MGIKVKETGPLPPTPEKKGLGWGWDVHKSNLEFKRTEDKLPITGRGKQVNMSNTYKGKVFDSHEKCVYVMISVRPAGRPADCVWFLHITKGPGNSMLCVTGVYLRDITNTIFFFQFCT